MATPVVIYGCGILGRSLIRDICYNQEKSGSSLYVKGIIDPTMDINQLLYLLKYDSINSQFSGYRENLSITIKDASTTPAYLDINGTDIPFYTQKITVDDQGAVLEIISGSYFIECTGTWTTAGGQINALNNAPYAVILPYNYGGNDIAYITMVNLENIESGTYKYQLGDLALGPISGIDWIICDNSLSTGPIQHVLVTGATNAQKIQDAATSSDYARGRSAMTNIIPLVGNVGKQVGRVLPELTGKVYSSEVRVPLASGCLLKTTFTPKSSTVDAASINAVLRQNAPSEVLGDYTEDLITTSDVPYHYTSKFGAPVALASKTYSDANAIAEITCIYEPIWCMVYLTQQVIAKIVSVNS